MSPTIPLFLAFFVNKWKTELQQSNKVFELSKQMTTTSINSAVQSPADQFTLLSHETGSS